MAATAINIEIDKPPNLRGHIELFSGCEDWNSPVLLWLRGYAGDMSKIDRLLIVSSEGRDRLKVRFTRRFKLVIAAVAICKSLGLR